MQLDYVKERNEQLMSENRNLNKYIGKLELLFKQRKNRDKISDSNRARHLKKFSNQAEATLWFTGSFGLTPDVIEGKHVIVRLSERQFNGTLAL